MPAPPSSRAATASASKKPNSSSSASAHAEQDRPCRLGSQVGLGHALLGALDRPLDRAVDLSRADVDTALPERRLRRELGQQVRVVRQPLRERRDPVDGDALDRHPRAARCRAVAISASSSRDMRGIRIWTSARSTERCSRISSSTSSARRRARASPATTRSESALIVSANSARARAGFPAGRTRRGRLRARRVRAAPPARGDVVRRHRACPDDARRLRDIRFRRRKADPERLPGRSAISPSALRQTQRSRRSESQVVRTARRPTRAARRRRRRARSSTPRSP